ncbi:MAG TPA: cytochrome c oxidase assembly protein [Gaiellaceae bacterium]|nr:cytochrome c oxidase assembly protein [Gaiellaceae bacterium]
MAAVSLQVPLSVIAVGALYALGGVGLVGSAHRHGERWRAAAFYAALVVLVIALESPIDTLADRSFALHMTQHVLLLTVVAPLVVLAAPWSRLWRPLPLGFRRAVARAVVVDPRFAWLRAAGRGCAQPGVAWTLFCGNLVAWHVPAAYDLTLRNGTIHKTEHLLFLATGVLFWAQVIPSRPFHVRLGEAARAFYALAAMGVGWVLAIVLAFERHPLYHPYAVLAHRPGGLTALGDQQVAAGVMWVPGSLAFSLAAVILLVRLIAPVGAQPLTPSLER